MVLTTEQIQAIKHGEPVRFVPPEVGEECVVIRATAYQEPDSSIEGVDPRRAYRAIDEAWEKDWNAAGMADYDRYEEHREGNGVMVRRGDIVLVYFPFASGTGGSRRPALVVQDNSYNSRLRNTVVAQITTNLSRADDRAHCLIRVATDEGLQSGLLHDSVVTCINLATIVTDRVDRAIGRLPESTMQQFDECLAVALAIKKNEVR